MLDRNNFYKNLNVLYINDDGDFLNFLKNRFNRVYRYTDKKEAINFYKKNKYLIHIVVCNISLDGLEILQKVRRYNKKNIFYFFGENIDKQLLLKSIKYNLTDFFQIPVQEDSFLNSLERNFKSSFFLEVKKNNQKELEQTIQIVDEISLVFKISVDKKVTYINNLFFNTLGYKLEDIKNKDYNFLKIDDNIVKNIEDSVFSKKVWYGRKVEIISKKNEKFSVYLSVIPKMKKNLVDIEEFVWILFISNKFEIKQSQFRQKIIENINNSRRINIEARNKIEELEKRLIFCKDLSKKYQEESLKKSKLLNQFNFFDKESKEIKSKLNGMKQKAKSKLSLVLEEERRVKLKKEQVSFSLGVVNSEFELKKKNIEDLTIESKYKENLIKSLRKKIREYEILLDKEN